MSVHRLADQDSALMSPRCVAASNRVHARTRAQNVRMRDLPSPRSFRSLQIFERSRSTLPLNLGCCNAALRNA
eukprot:5702865-Karenia_brevis.AAC.1